MRRSRAARSVGAMKIQIIKKPNTDVALRITCLLAAAVIAGCESESGEGHEHRQADLKAQAKISEADARATALARVPDGTIKEAELEKEKGKLIWSFDMARPETKDTTEVNVDAITGEIVGVDIEKADKKDKD
jgi:uncharacterized membrane protein YkoI